MHIKNKCMVGFGREGMEMTSQMSNRLQIMRQGVTCCQSMGFSFYFSACPKGGNQLQQRQREKNTLPFALSLFTHI